MQTLQLILGLSLTATMVSGLSGARRIELEVFMERGVEATDAHRWMESLRTTGLDSIRFRTAKPGDRIHVTSQGKNDNIRYQVTGALTPSGHLKLPGGEFTRGNRPDFIHWVENLRIHGSEIATARSAAFGLTPRQAKQVFDVLSLKVDTSTQGESAKFTIEQISNALSIKIDISPTASLMLAEDTTVQQQYRDLTSGTVMAAILRPLNLALVPQNKSEQGLTLSILEVRQSKESWPIGWSTSRKLLKTVPKLMERVEVEIQDQPLVTVVTAISKRIDVPLLWNHHDITRLGIDPQEITVSFPAKRTYYKRILDHVLARGKLNMEIRVDEAGQPFVWISGIQRR